MLKYSLRIPIPLCLFGIFLNSTIAQNTQIWEIQGTGASSPVVGQTVTTQNNVVTARGNGFFTIQSRIEDSDNDPSTSDAIVVANSYFGQVGDVVNVTGQVLEEDGLTVLAGPGLIITPTGQTAPLPEAVAFSSSFPSPAFTVPHSLERVEGMRIQFQGFANGPSSGSSDVVPVRMSPDRVFREPGISAPGLPGLPVFDTNPELFWLDPNGLNAPNNRFIESNAQISATGIIIEADEGYWLALPDAYTVEPGPAAQPVREKADGEFTIGCLNTLFLIAENSNAETKYQKIARYIIDQMRVPDVVAIQEAGSLSALNNLAFFLEQAHPDAKYDAYLLPTNLDLKTGYLVREDFSGVEVAQLGADEPFTFSGGLLHDRPPLLLRFNLPTSPPTPVQVLNLHIRSLLGIEGSTSAFVRNKRHQQAVSVAEMVSELQEDGNLIVVGDFNAFEFTDGYVDVFAQISGQESLGAQFEPLPVVSPPLEAEILKLPAPQRYSYVFDGSAQALDHCLTGNFTGLISNGMQYARGNADFTTGYANNTSSPLRASDHDGFVLFIEPEAPVATAAPATPAPPITMGGPNPAAAGQLLYVESAYSLESVRIVNMSGQEVWQAEIQGQSGHISWPMLPSGLYLLQVANEMGSMAFKWAGR